MEPAFNSEAGVRVLQWFVDFYKANQVSKRVQNYFLDGTRSVFASGAVKMNLVLAGWASFFNDPANSKVANKTCYVRAPK
jgi:multiple sugar transport system substrate-binding protein